MNRRDMLKTAGSAAAISVLGGIPLNLSAKDKVSRRNRKKIMIIGTQTQMFHPNDFVDITTTRERKHQACYCHASQKLQSVMADWHIPMEQFRGIECRCKAAEAFFRHVEPASLV